MTGPGISGEKLGAPPSSGVCELGRGLRRRRDRDCDALVRRLLLGNHASRDERRELLQLKPQILHLPLEQSQTCGDVLAVHALPEAGASRGRKACLAWHFDRRTTLDVA